MTVFLNIYIIIYTITLCCLVYLLQLASTFNYNNSLPVFITKINSFSKLKAPILTLLLSLSGLPPFFLFFIKFNYLSYIFLIANPVVIFFIFIAFFLNMLYYIQIFFFKSESPIDLTIIYKNNKINYNILFYVYMYIFILLFSVFFVTDYIYILKLL